MPRNRGDLPPGGDPDQRHQQAETGRGPERNDEGIHRPGVQLLAGKKIEFGVGKDVDGMDFHVEAIDLMNNGAVVDVGVAFFVAAFSALRHTPATAATLILAT